MEKDVGHYHLAWRDSLLGQDVFSCLVSSCCCFGGSVGLQLCWVDEREGLALGGHVNNGLGAVELSSILRLLSHS